jgi:hypothetical protein
VFFLLTELFLSLRSVLADLMSFTDRDVAAVSGDDESQKRVVLAQQQNLLHFHVFPSVVHVGSSWAAFSQLEFHQKRPLLEVEIHDTAHERVSRCFVHFCVLSFMIDE